MISEPTYLAAKMVSNEIKEYFEKQYESGKKEGEQATLIPDTYVIEAIIDTAFWASL